VSLVRDRCIYVFGLSILLSCPFSKTICHAHSSQDPFLFIVVDVAAVRELIADRTKKLYTVV
jgi:hypothetical protein